MDPIKIVDKLNQMKSELMARGWAKTHLESSDGRICLLGARNLVIHGETLQEESLDGRVDGFEKDEITNALIEVLVQRPEWREEILNNDFSEPDSTTHVWMFNDNDETEFNDVIGLLDEAIITQKDKM